MIDFFLQNKVYAMQNGAGCVIYMVPSSAQHAEVNPCVFLTQQRLLTVLHDGDIISLTAKAGKHLRNVRFAIGDAVIDESLLQMADIDSNTKKGGLPN